MNWYISRAVVYQAALDFSVSVAGSWALANGTFVQLLSASSVRSRPVIRTSADAPRAVCMGHIASVNSSQTSEIGATPSITMSHRLARTDSRTVGWTRRNTQFASSSVGIVNAARNPNTAKNTRTSGTEIVYARGASITRVPLSERSGGRSFSTPMAIAIPK